MGGFDRKRLLANIATLTKEKNIRMGDLEAAAGVSAGYFSRLNKGESNATPNIEIIAAVADKLEVTIDCLVKVDYDILTPSERYLIDFINKLIEKTNACDMVWEAESVRRMLGAGVDRDGCANHPLFVVKSINMGVDGTNDYSDFDRRPVYNSMFHDDEIICPRGPAYHIDFDDNSVLWITDIGVMDDGESPQNEEIELILQNRYNYEISPICHTVANGQSPFNRILFSLYHAAAESSKRPKINPSVKAAIDSFMEELPF